MHVSSLDGPRGLDGPRDEIDGWGREHGRAGSAPRGFLASELATAVDRLLGTAAAPLDGAAVVRPHAPPAASA
ncbi:hypothetical protein [Paludisphaera mucosa]|uniref:Uncharacterized protein n=1 Tax=Paludisphaera mucosa TaxID=3030827 RepID=A0ABT6FJM1_9BACT|nr:hypothetical protein [Paludisphaera mucosa]MDG3007782.1 hypothetical protein [Paludisphaera mucosa]